MLFSLRNNRKQGSMSFIISLLVLVILSGNVYAHHGVYWERHGPYEIPNGSFPIDPPPLKDYELNPNRSRNYTVADNVYSANDLMNRQKLQQAWAEQQRLDRIRRGVNPSVMWDPAGWEEAYFRQRTASPLGRVLLREEVLRTQVRQLETLSTLRNSPNSVRASLQVARQQHNQYLNGFHSDCPDCVAPTPLNLTQVIYPRGNSRDLKKVNKSRRARGLPSLKTEREAHKTVYFGGTYRRVQRGKGGYMLE